jgi:hypothetical protein
MKISLLAAQGVFHSELLIISNRLDILFRSTKFRPTMEDTELQAMVLEEGPVHT